MRIVKNGLYNEVNEELFKKVYEPKGWVRADKEKKAVESIENKTINEPNGEQKIKEFANNKNQNRKKAKFNDKIIKE